MSAAGKPLDGTGLAVVNQIIEDRLKAKQDKLTGTAGQMVGFNAQGQAVAQAVPSTGVTSFKGRTGAVTPQAGDYTATQVGARPSTWTPTAADVGAVPTTRKVNNKALSADISLTAADVGALASGGTAAAATKLATSRTIRTNLGSTSTASFNGTANVTPGVTGTLGIAHGGTGSTTAAGALANLGADSRYLKLSGGDMTGMLDMNNNALTGIPNPVSPADAVNFNTLISSGLNCIPLTVLFYAGSTIVRRGVVYATKRTSSGPNVILDVFGDMFGNSICEDNRANKVVILKPNYALNCGDWSDFNDSYIWAKYTGGGGSTGSFTLEPDGKTWNYTSPTNLSVATRSTLLFGGMMVYTFGSTTTDWSRPL